MGCRIEITTHSYWHAGSGISDGPGADALVIKTSEGLPYLPGKSIRGLLRESTQQAEDLGLIAKGSTEKFFGTALAESKDNSKSKEEDWTRFKSKQGCIHISNAYIGDSPAKQNWWKEWASENTSEKQQFFTNISSTSIDENGVSKKGHLRTIEVTVPMKLVAMLEIDDKTNEGNSVDSEEVIELLSKGLPLFRLLGSHRNRGLGRCSVSIEQYEGGNQ